MDPFGLVNGLITEDTILSNGDVFASGDVTVAPGARLLLDRVTLTFLSTRDTHPVLRVLPGASLDIIDSRVTNHAPTAGPDRVAAYYRIDVQGRAHVSESRIEYARSLDLRGPGASGSVIEHSVFDEMAWSGVQTTRGASVTIRDNTFTDIHFRPLDGDSDPLGAGVDQLGGGVVLVDASSAFVAGNTFERVSGTAVIVAQSTGTGSFVRETSGLIVGNVIVTDHTVAFYADGGSPALHFENNAIFTGSIGAFTAYGSGAELRGNDFLARPGAFAGIWASGVTGMKARAHEINVFNNRFRGFDAAVVQSDGADPFLRMNDLAGNAVGARGFGEGNGEFLDPDGTLDARANWWGDASGPRDTDEGDGTVPATNPEGRGAGAEGFVDYSTWLTSEPAYAGDLDSHLVKVGPRHFTLTVTNTGTRSIHPELSLHGMPDGAGARVRMPSQIAPGATVEIPIFTYAPPMDLLITGLRHPGGATLAAA